MRRYLSLADELLESKTSDRSFRRSLQRLEAIELG